MAIYTDQGDRHITVPSKKDVESVKLWMREHAGEYSLATDDPFDMAVNCSHDVRIFADDDYTIAQWIVRLAEDYFDGLWK